MTVSECTAELSTPLPCAIGLPSDARAGGATPFWSAGIGVGVAAILSQLAELDTLAQKFGGLPHQQDGAVGGRILAANYLATLTGLSAYWLQRSRPVLLQALRALDGVPTCLAQLALAMAPAEAQAAVSQLETATARLGQVNTDVGQLLEHMALASADLETDTVLVAYRLQADRVHAAMLTQQEETLRRRLDGARRRAPVGQRRSPLACGAGDSAVLDSTRRQLAQLHAAQADTVAEAARLEELLPSLSACLVSVERMGAGIDTALRGMRVTQRQLHALVPTMAPGPRDHAAPQLPSPLASRLASQSPSPSQMQLQLQVQVQMRMRMRLQMQLQLQMRSALPQWRQLAARIRAVG